MGIFEVLALSVAGNIVLGFALLSTKRKLFRAVQSIIEVGQGRAEVVDLGDRIAVKHKIITQDKDVTL